LTWRDDREKNPEKSNSPVAKKRVGFLNPECGVSHLQDRAQYEIKKKSPEMDESPKPKEAPVYKPCQSVGI